MNEELKRILLEAEATNVEAAEKFLSKEIVKLQESGFLGLSDDKDLTGLSLELRAQQLFIGLGIDIQKGRPGLEDFVIPMNPDNIYKDNIVTIVRTEKREK